MRVKTLTSLIAISGGKYSENTTTFGVNILQTLDADPITDHKGLIRSSYGVLVVLRAIMHVLKCAPKDVKHVVVSKEKYIQYALTPSSDLYGWHPDGSPTRVDVATPEYKTLKVLSDERRFEFVSLPDKMTKYRRLFSFARKSAAHTRNVAERRRITLCVGQELWNSELDLAE